MIAMDGKYLHTGGHNLWDKHYLRHSPVFDLSVELRGPVAHDGHMFANNAWKYIKHVQGNFGGRLMENWPDHFPAILKGRVIVPPLYQPLMMPKLPFDVQGSVKVITMGRTGSGAHPSDDAFVAMLNAAQKVIRMALQDLGPVCFPNTLRALPGCVWPHGYLEAIARGIWKRGEFVCCC